MPNYHLLLAIVIYSVVKINAQAPLNQSTNATFIPDDLPIDDDLDSHYPNVLSVKFHLLHRKVPELLTKISLMEMGCPINECNISLSDVVEAIQLERYDRADIAKAIGQMNITGRDAYNIFLLYNLNATGIENLLIKAGTTFSDVYKNIVDKLADPVNTIPRVLGVLNVSVIDFMNAQAYGNDTVKLQVLATGNYTYENVQSILNITNKTGIDILEAFPLNTMAKQVRNFEPAAFRNFVKNLGVTSGKLADFYGYLNVTSIHFIAYPGYTQILTDFERDLNPEEVLATALSNTTLVTSNKAKSLTRFQTENTAFVRNYSYYQAENVENPLTHYHIKNVILSNGEYKADDIAIIEVHNAYKDNITQLSATYNATALSNCTYVTKLPFGDIYVENFTVATLKGHVIALPKSNKTLYNLGSPLFCQDKLVAMATENGINEILFSTFMKKTGEEPKPPGPPGSATTPPGSVTISQPGSGLTKSANIASVILLMGLAILLN